MRVFWRGTPPAEASTRPSEWAKWRQGWWSDARSAQGAVPAGDKQWVTVKLAGLPGYEGGLTGLAIDIPDGVSIHEIRLSPNGR